MALVPQFASIPKVGAGSLSAANTNRDGTGTLVTIVTAGTNGSRIDSVTVCATATTTAGMVRLFLHDGTTAFLLKEIPVSSITPSGTVQAFSAYLTSFTNPELFPKTIPSGWSLRASTNNAEAFRVIADAPDL